MSEDPSEEAPTPPHGTPAPVASPYWAPNVDANSSIDCSWLAGRTDAYWLK